LKFPEGGLGPIQSDPQNKESQEMDTKELEDDDDFDGMRLLKPTRVRQQIVPLRRSPSSKRRQSFLKDLEVEG